MYGDASDSGEERSYRRGSMPYLRATTPQHKDSDLRQGGKTCSSSRATASFGSVWVIFRPEQQLDVIMSNDRKPAKAIHTENSNIRTCFVPGSLGFGCKYVDEKEHQSAASSGVSTAISRNLTSRSPRITTTISS